MIYLVIAVIQILYVALNSLRVVLMIKGRKYLAAVLCTIEIFVYMSGLTLVLKYMDSYLGMATYCLSYGLGILVGIYIEQKIALGFITLQVITENEYEMGIQLRSKGYGVTNWYGSGFDGTRIIYLILVKRKEYTEVISTIQNVDPKAFIISYEPKYFVGGFIRNKVG